MNQVQIDNALHNEYLEYMGYGATNVEALLQVATVNEMSCVDVFDALARHGVRNPCAECD